MKNPLTSDGFAQGKFFQGPKLFLCVLCAFAVKTNINFLCVLCAFAVKKIFRKIGDEV